MSRDYHLLAALVLLLAVGALAHHVPAVGLALAAAGFPVGVEYVRRSARRTGRAEAEPLPIHHLIECAGR